MKIDELLTERNSNYGGSFYQTDRAISAMIDGDTRNLQHLLDAGILANWVIMMSKMNRAVYSPQKDDHYRDLQGYAKLIERVLAGDNLNVDGFQPDKSNPDKFGPDGEDLLSSEALAKLREWTRLSDKDKERVLREASVFEYPEEDEIYPDDECWGYEPFMVIRQPAPSFSHSLTPLFGAILVVVGWILLVGIALKIVMLLK